ncbi:MAG: prepilin-type N-terminal cleavage/methylation domain-containing protein [Chitinivibrionales bacterium]|nr:prepilin-type N-terminal cleavage/methylation domain-containing protein [Chitinivibrionales bacterium]
MRTTLLKKLHIIKARTGLIFCSSKKNDTGFTLVEMLVASSVFAIGIIGFIALVAKGRELDVGDRHRRLARYLIDSCFEDPAYSFANYAHLEDLENDYERILDERRPDTTGDELLCTLLVVVTDSSVYPEVGGSAVDVKKIRVSAYWLEPEGFDTLTLEKWITGIP